MPPARVLAVAPGSPAAHAGIQPGDELLSLCGEELTDVIRYTVLADGPDPDLEVRRGGLELTITPDKAEGTPLGIELESAVFDRVRTCDNHCPFCFIYQLPEGMRPSLSLKDDDYRLSFLYGNFTTLTRFTEADLERVVTEALGPLYVSIHATDPDLRTRLLRNRRGATSLRWLAALLDAGIEVHGQVVVCPGINDGDAFDDTMLGVFDRFPGLATVGVVPLGVSAHNREPEMRPHTSDEAVDLVERVEAWQDRFLAALGRRMVFASDECYLHAGRPLPSLEDYEGAPQHENGIGIVATFADEVRRAAAGEDLRPVGVRSGFFAWVDGAPAAGYRAERVPSCSGDHTHDHTHADTDGDSATATTPQSTPVAFTAVRNVPTPSRSGSADDAVTVLTGRYAEAPLRALVEELTADPTKGLPDDVEVVGVDNTFFGGNIAVTGLLTGADIAEALDRVPRHRRVLLPDVTLSEGRFLDGTTPADLDPAPEIVPTDGVSFVAALRGVAAVRACA